LEMVRAFIVSIWKIRRKKEMMELREEEKCILKIEKREASRTRREGRKQAKPKPFLVTSCIGRHQGCAYIRSQWCHNRLR
jgi:hypothetical protein